MCSGPTAPVGIARMSVGQRTSTLELQHIMPGPVRGRLEADRGPCSMQRNSETAAMP